MTEMFVCYEQGYSDAEIKFVTPSKTLATKWEKNKSARGYARFVEEVPVRLRLPRGES